MSGSLSHLRVLDLSRVLAGPWAGQILGDLGAEVIKIERPKSGDDTRSWGPPYLQGADGNADLSAYFLTANRNKQSLAVDIAHPEGQELIRKLVAESDVILENFKVGGLKRYGLDYDSLKQINPKLIYCSITGFGQDGPYANRPGYDFLIQAMGGLMSITGQPDGEPGAGPMKVGVALTDIMTGLYATIGVLAALSHRDRTGEGQYVEAALLDVQVACLANQAMNYLTTGQAPGRMGNAHPNIVPYQDFPTADGNMVLTVGNDEQFTRLCDVLEHPEWASDERFATNRARVANRKELIPRLRQATVMRSTQEWVQILERSGVPCGPVNTLDQVFEDPQVLARGMKQSVQHPSLGDVPTVGNPIRLKLTPVSYRTAPPLLGEQSKQVLEKIVGLSSGEIESLRERGIVS
ncbi:MULTISPECIES: CaiB/BaiF CoA-transferase family protein [Marinobacter]|jgi:crotonobetainyl-CoA:carnitine CoA-transferase CaiB-like acyl-CoA transferase|uniref:CaiB/BaiF CoA transferase family protein n=2 Tax=Marinobacteraceae TaxID=2887365 RepID=UPI000C89FF25|nr:MULTISPECIES: CaiB/BaiF CoA-transferase family protein [Marinobacter]MAB50621.1 CoA transferase [Marinobacter sp.]WOI18060.1 CaiB/BaiF CoA-transferase family protein [Marinobacter salarius]|tara:strand:+ start:1295 stop:2518 length:1224 start_codon:yes stop_codon:yes gene_type:complete